MPNPNVFDYLKALPNPAGVLQARADAAAELIHRRQAAAFDYWNAAASLREPADLVSLNAGYWARLVEDYGVALRAGLASPKRRETQVPV